MPVTVTLFVYGTLKRGCRNHGVMRGAEFVDEVATQPAYLMVNCGSYPGLVKAANDQTGMSIRGELYRVDEEMLVVLDRFEDVPAEFVRGTIWLEDGSEAQAYFYILSTAGLEMCGPDWVE
jgi:gamma-glutamylaminecyclotransferase